MIVIRNPESITQAINRFKTSYHNDYYEVRKLSETYLNGNTSDKHINALSEALFNAINNWGAGRRKAPSPKNISDFILTLKSSKLYENLKNLKSCKNEIGITNNRRYISDSLFDSIEEFDSCLLTTLRELSVSLFEDNTNVTYPMKCLLLFTGLLPAYDSQVKKGMKIAGFKGVDKTQYLLPTPKQQTSSDSKKICTIPFIIADCVKLNRSILDSAIEKSRYPELKEDYGRVFDIIFFMQDEENVIVEISHFDKAQWYNI